MSEITVQSYACGPYLFHARLPAIGLSNDQRRWYARVERTWLPSAFTSLEAAMQAAINTTLAAIAKAEALPTPAEDAA